MFRKGVVKLQAHHQTGIYLGCVDCGLPWGDEALTKGRSVNHKQPQQNHNYHKKVAGMKNVISQ